MSDDFLSRWSRRKRSGDVPEAPKTAAETGVEAETAADPAAEAAADESDAELLARLGLRHPDEMGPGDDFAGFLKAAVPRHLRQLALRRLWRSNPTLACLDGLNDYDTDFTGTGVPEGGLKTSYEVGRGILRRIAEVAEEPPVEAAAEAPAFGAGDGAGAGSDESDQAAAAAPEMYAAPPEKMQSAEIVQENDAGRATRRRMVFRTNT